MTGTDLAGADSVSADLAGAGSVSADLAGADSVSADLSGTDLAGADLVRAVEAAVSQVCDPEYPDLTIAELGILEKVWLRGASVDGASVDGASVDGASVDRAGADDASANGMPTAVSTIGPATVVIDLVPTISGCPALDVIRADVLAAAQTALVGTAASASADDANAASAASASAAGTNTADVTAAGSGASATAADAAGAGTTAGASDPAVEVRFLSEPIWTTERISQRAEKFLAREYTVAVRTKAATPVCPHCGADDLQFRSDFGPTPCRRVYWCPACRNPIEMVDRS